MRPFTSGLLLAVLALGAACSPPRVEAPPTAPSLSDPSDVMPADLDVVLRVDVARCKATLGLIPELLASEIAMQLPSAPGDEPTRDHVFAWVARADTLWLGLRPGSRPETSDGVLILRGDFSAIVPTRLEGAPAWGLVRDLGGAVRRYERAPTLRSAPAVLYTRLPERLVLGSLVEIDALGRTVEQGQAGSDLRAPESGLLSVALRVPGLEGVWRRRWPELARFIDGAERAEASVEQSGAKFRVHADLRYAEADRAASVGESASKLIRSLAEAGPAWAKDIRVEVVERHVSLDWEIDRADLDRLLLGSASSKSRK